MGLLDRFRKTPEKASGRISQMEDLKTIGIMVTVNEDARERRDNRKDFLTKAKTFHSRLDGNPDTQLEKMIETLEEMDALIKENSVPWGRAGTMSKGSRANWYAMMMGVYEEIMGLVKTDAQVIHSLIVERDDYDLRFKRSLVGHIRNTIIEEIIPRMKQVEDFSWQDQDVTPQYVPVIQSQVIPGRGQGIDLNREAEKL